MFTSRLVGEIAENRVALATMTPPTARDLLFISTYDSTDPESNAHNQHGYQRPPMPKRYREIASYFTSNGHRHLITPLIVSVRLQEREAIARFMKLLDHGDVSAIRQTFGDKVASIVDGQHRFNGLVTAWEEDPEFLPKIPTMLYFGLSFVQEAELFNTINVTQRKLPKALIETTRGDITEADQATFAQAIRRLTFGLCRDEDSVWGPKDGVETVNMTGVRDPNRPVSYEGLRRSTLNMFPAELYNRLVALDEDLPLKLAKRYWAEVAESCKEAWFEDPGTRTEVDPATGQSAEVKIKYRIKDLVGVASLAKLGKDIVTSQLDSGEGDRLDQLTRKLAEVDWEKRADNVWMRSQAGFAGQKELHLTLHRLVFSDLRPGEAEEL